MRAKNAIGGVRSNQLISRIHGRGTRSSDERLQSAEEGFVNMSQKESAEKSRRRGGEDVEVEVRGASQEKENTPLRPGARGDATTT